MSVQREIERLTLEGVISGPSPVAVISGELYQAGAVLDETGLRIVSIDTQLEVVRIEHEELPGELYDVVMDKD